MLQHFIPKAVEKLLCAKRELPGELAPAYLVDPGLLLLDELGSCLLATLGIIGVNFVPSLTGGYYKKHICIHALITALAPAVTGLVRRHQSQTFVTLFEQF